MYRKYRVGELPDIQIKHSELIRPFQALAQVSKPFSRTKNIRVHDMVTKYEVDRVNELMYYFLDGSLILCRGIVS